MPVSPKARACRKTSKKLRNGTSFQPITEFAQAQYRLGTFYERGFGVKADRARAAAWYQRAAEQGNIKAMHNLAVLSANQTDELPDYTTAARWFEEAAKRGLADSQFNLAVLYENGLGVKRDMKMAFMWLALAARNGDKDAVRRRDILRGKLTAEEIVAAEQMIAALEAGAERPHDQRCPHRGGSLEEQPQERSQRLGSDGFRASPRLARFCGPSDKDGPLLLSRHYKVTAATCRGLPISVP